MLSTITKDNIKMKSLSKRGTLVKQLSSLPEYYEAIMKDKFLYFECKVYPVNYFYQLDLPTLKAHIQNGLLWTYKPKRKNKNENN